jgi:S1-C subfamily serine protease
MTALVKQRRQLLRLAGALMPALWQGSVNAELPATVARLKPSVLLVGTYGATDSPRFGFRGTGFVVGNGNLAITNAHVLPESSEGQVSRDLAIQAWSAPDTWRLRLATVIAVDRARDLALLGFDGPALPAVELASDKPAEGARVAFMGFPLGGALGFAHVTHRGIISSIAAMAIPMPSARQLDARAVFQMRHGSFEIFQLDATAYPGNSGGPMFDPDTGAVIGVINSVLVKGSREAAISHPSGISYGIPVAHVRQLLLDTPR